MNEVH